MKEWSEEKAIRSIKRLVVIQFILSVIGFWGMLGGNATAGFTLLMAVPMLSIATMGVIVYTYIWDRNTPKPIKIKEAS